MTAVAKSGTPSLSTTAPGGDAWVGSGLKAGEDIAAADACYIRSDGKVWRSIGTTTNAAAKVDGFAAKAAKSGEAVTLMVGVDFNYGSGLTPGDRYYVSGTAAGGLDTAPSTGGTGAVAKAIGTARIRVNASTY